MPNRSPAHDERPPVALARARFPVPVLDVLRTLGEAGHRSWLVGGAIRDLLLGRAHGDLDVATPARPEQVTALFPKVIPTGIEHGTVTVVLGGGSIEVTTFRGEGAYVDGRRPSSVTFLDDVDQDLARRDFTVNALAYDPLGGEFRDPFGGRADLRRGVLRAVGDPAARFAEDGLRPFRAARFAAQLGFRLDPATAAAIPGALHVAGKVSVERIGEELSRLVVAPHARHALELLAGTGLLAVALPEAASVPADARAHAFQAVAAAGRDLELRLAALLHVLTLGEPAPAAARRVSGILDRLRLPGRVRDGAAALVLHQGGCLLARQEPPLPTEAPEARRWLSRVGRARAPALLALWDADARAVRPFDRSRRARASLRAFRARLARLERARPPLSIGELALDGHGVVDILGVPAGPAVGDALRYLLDRVLDDPALNTRESLSSELKGWWGSRASS